MEPIKRVAESNGRTSPSRVVFDEAPTALIGLARHWLRFAVIWCDLRPPVFGKTDGYYRIGMR